MILCDDIFINILILVTTSLSIFSQKIHGKKFDSEHLTTIRANINKKKVVDVLTSTKDVYQGIKTSSN